MPRSFLVKKKKLQKPASTEDENSVKTQGDLGKNTTCLYVILNL